jgi:hypothetical protein
MTDNNPECEGCGRNFIQIVVRFEMLDGVLSMSTFCPHCGLHLGVVPI